MKTNLNNSVVSNNSNNNDLLDEKSLNEKLSYIN